MNRTTTVERQRSVVGFYNDENLPRIAGYEKRRGGIVQLLESARQTAAQSVNTLITASYWGNRPTHCRA